MIDIEDKLCFILAVFKSNKLRQIDKINWYNRQYSLNISVNTNCIPVMETKWMKFINCFFLSSFSSKLYKTNKEKSKKKKEFRANDLHSPTTNKIKFCKNNWIEPTSNLIYADFFICTTRVPIIVVTEGGKEKIPMKETILT